MTAPVISNVTWTDLFDAGLGTDWSAQGWTAIGTFSASTAPTGGWSNLQGAGAYWRRTNATPLPVSGRVLVSHIRFRLEAGHVYQAGFDTGWGSLNAGQADYTRVLFDGSWSSWGNTQYTAKSFVTSAGPYAQKGLLTVATTFDLLKISYLDGLNCPQLSTQVWMRAAGAESTDSAKGYFRAFNALAYTNQNTNRIQVGDVWSAAGQDWSVALVRTGIADAGVIVDQFGLPLFGAVSDVPVAAVTVSPASIAAGETASATAVLTNTTATLGGNPWDGTAQTVATGSADPTPTIALTITPDEVVAGETAAASAVLDGATATLNGVSWDGSSTTVVTGTSNGTDPPGPVTARLATPPSRPVVRIVS